MDLSSLARTRAALSRAAARFILQSPRLRALAGNKRKRPVDGRVVDDEIAAILGLDELISNTDLRRSPPPVSRARMAESVLVGEAEPLTGLHTRNLSFEGPRGPIPARLYEPHDLEAPSPGLVYIHGGGWVVCDLDTHDTFCRRLALRGGARVLSIDYRLAPENRFPAAVEDSVAAFRFAAANASSLGMDPRRLGVGGDSAGGNLSAVVAQKTRGDEHPPALSVLIYPAVDATRSHRSHSTLGEGWFLTTAMINWYLSHYIDGTGTDLKNPELSPLFADDFKGISPTLVYTAGFDPLRDEAEVYAGRLRDAGVPVQYHCFEELIHGFTLMTGLSRASHDASERIAREVGEALRGGVGIEK